ncbi:MAG TPA: PQQ-binding-like beta-propeller repeat protein [Planctomycetaceae bacterium]|nr:PQQ-binding-like beta-propeller repeat protein [Planctomycetaceae bacterium]
MRLFVALMLSLTTAVVAAEDRWPNWRGTDFNGVAQGTGYPTQWSATDNVAWKVELPGRGSSTPVVWGNHVFLTCGSDGKNLLLAYNLSGKELWRETLGSERPGKNKKASGANSSCVTDGESVFAYFKSGDLICTDFGGKKRWQVNLQDKFGEDTLWWDLGTSPVLTQKHCVVAVMQTGNSYIVAFDKRTGEVAWKVDRNLDAPEEAAQSYSTPVVHSDNGEELLIVLGADHVTAHRAENGEEVWRVGGLNPTQHKYFRSIASPAVLDGVVVAPYARGDSVTGIKLGGKGDVTSTHVVWKKQGNGPDVPSPAAANGRAYILNDKGTVTCVEVATGKVIWTGQTEKNRHGFSASPVLADGKLYITREDGKTFVLAQGPEFKILAANELDGTQTVASPVLVNGRILLRTDTHLYCIAAK